ncbi:hypothetical protein ACEPAF_8666 [Sanghuangporus sanghuang]
MPFGLLIREGEGGMSEFFEGTDEIYSNSLLAVSSLRSTASHGKNERQVHEFDDESLISELSDLTDLSDDGLSVPGTAVDQLTAAGELAAAGEPTAAGGSIEDGEDEVDGLESGHETGNIERYWTRNKGIIVRLVKRTVPVPAREPVPVQFPESASAPVPKFAPISVPKQSNSFHWDAKNLERPVVQTGCNSLFQNFYTSFENCDTLLDRSKLVFPPLSERMSKEQVKAMEELRSKALKLRDESIVKWSKQQPKTCTDCRVSEGYLKSNQGRRRHLLTHYPEGIFCPICVHIFARECSLDRHLSTKSDSCLDKPEAKRFLLGRTPEGKIARGLDRRVFNLYYLGAMEDFPMPDDQFQIIAGRERHALIRLKL